MAYATDDLALDQATVAGLVSRAAAGDAAAFSAIYDEYSPRVRRFLRHQAGDADLAEELLQRTFVKMIEALPHYRDRGLPFGAWVFRIARNTVIDHRRTSHPALPLDAAVDRAADGDDPAVAAEREVEGAELRAALGTLPDDQREVLALRFFADLSPAETAGVMGRSYGAVRVLQHRALTSLRRQLGPTAAGTEGDLP